MNIRALILRVFLATGSALVLLLGGCAGSAILKGSGELTAPPAGYSVECVNHPELENCKP